MQLQKRKSNRQINLYRALAMGIAFLAMGIMGNANGEFRSHFRTPARLYGSAYSVKVTLKRDGTEFVAPFWVKPDQTYSTIDLKMMADLGWYYQDTKLDEMKIADQVMPPPTFRKAKSDWAFVPEFPQTCCYGVLGQDFLSRFKIRFEPRKPTHVEWDDLELPLKSYPPSKLLLSPLFNLRSDVVTYQKKKLDLADVAYDLNLSKKELILEPFVPTEKQKRARREKPIFTFSIMPPIRILKITSIDPSVQKAAKAIGIKIGSVIWAVENESVIFLDQFYVERALKGRSDSKLELLISDSLKLTKRRTVFFDFEKSEFSEPLPEKNPEAPVPDPATKVLQKALDDTKK